MSNISRRQLLMFFGATAVTTTIGPSMAHRLLGGTGNPGIAEAAAAGFTPVRLPHPLPIYQRQDSFMPTRVNGAGRMMKAEPNPRLTSYEVVDDVTVPPEFERYVIVAWGDRVFPNSSDYFGYNNDYTGFVPINGSLNDGYLGVNHEYVSYPFSEYTTSDAELQAAGSSFPDVIGFSLPAGSDLTALSDEEALLVLGEVAYNQGFSVVRINRASKGDRFTVVKGDSKNRRIHLLSGLQLNVSRGLPTAWGNRPHQKGDNNYLVGTGPAASQVFSKSEDGLGNKIIGTAFNCSGGTTPWGTILTAEENFQETVSEAVTSDGTQVAYVEGIGQEFGLVGEKYGWMVEIDLENPGVRAKKHTALGRFRHENIAFRLKEGEPLVAYMGDDRRGGHTWKYVSSGRLGKLDDKSNSNLFENGTLYVAKFNANGSGEWLPLKLTAPTAPNQPSEIGSAELAALGSAQRGGLVKLPQRVGVAGATEDGGAVNVTVSNEATVLPDYRGKTLQSFYSSQGAVLVDAFLAANAIGGTPSSRPEDLEVNPLNGDVIIAYTDHIAGGDGYPDSRIFQTFKPTASPNAQQPSGGLYKIIESSGNGAGTSFQWDKLQQGGEAGAQEGAGYANVDNLLIDDLGGIWGVTDMSTSQHNGFNTGAVPELRTIDHSATGATSDLVGVFGNNWVFYIPTRGPNAGEIMPFGYGPMRCEITGPTLVDDTLIAAVQHPGEDVPIGDRQQAQLSREIEMLDLNGSLFNQQRTLPLGSNWPSNIGYPLPSGRLDRQGPPRPSVIGIRRVA